MKTRPYIWLAVLILLGAALVFRLSLVFILPARLTGDGPMYTRLARNLFEQKIYSVDTEPPYRPTVVRMPGYPLFLVLIYFAGYHDRAVHIAQAIIDTASCALIAILAFNWAPNKRSRWAAALAALAVAAVCPFTAIYVKLILSETLAIFLFTAMALAATYAIKAATVRRSVIWWAVAGAICGLAVLVRPDSALAAAGLGLTLLITSLFECCNGAGGWAGRGRCLKSFTSLAFLRGAAFSVTLFIVLSPWAIRNAVIFHTFHPLATFKILPADGYYKWVRTWIDDDLYINPVIWSLYSNKLTIPIDQIPEKAFDSDEERARVIALLEEYNHSKITGVLNMDVNALYPYPEMPSHIDAGFAQIAEERIQRNPLRYYMWLPAKRAITIWFDPHSLYYPSGGGSWIHLFTALLGGYTLLGMAGVWEIWRMGEPSLRHCILLVALITLPRLAFFSTIENPEPRYVVELFPFLSALGGVAIGQFSFKGKT